MRLSLSFWKRTCPEKALDLPRHDPAVVEWTPPPPIQMPALAQAQALIALFQSEGRTGVIPHHELIASYPELAWSRGFVQLSERAMLKALGQVCQKVRPYPDKVSSFIVPGPNDKRHKSAPRSKVVPLSGRIKPGIRAEQSVPWPELPQQAQA